jgi:hypothetical protein
MLEALTVKDENGQPQRRDFTNAEPVPPEYRKKLKPKQKVMLHWLRESLGHVGAACDGAGVGYHTLWMWRRDDVRFDQLCWEAANAGVDDLVLHVIRRAKDKDDKASALLAMFMLKAARRPTFQDNYQPPEVEKKIQVAPHIGTINVNILDGALRDYIAEQARQKMLEIADTKKVKQAVVIEMPKQEVAA